MNKLVCGALMVLALGLAVMLGWEYRQFRKKQIRLQTPIGAGWETKVSDGYNPGRLKFKLGDGQVVKAAMAGKIDYAGETMRQTEKALNIQIGDPASKTTISYLLAPGVQIRVKEGQKVAAGETVAVVPEGSSGLTCLGGANVGVTLVKDGVIRGLSEKDFL
jgi:murein DD-endopeptidase MepM/ murein hydrolase activator NlpD